MHKIQSLPCTAPRQKNNTSRVIQTFCSLRAMHMYYTPFLTQQRSVYFMWKRDRLHYYGALFVRLPSGGRKQLPKLGLNNSYKDIAKRRQATTTNFEILLYSPFTLLFQSHTIHLQRPERRGVAVNTTVSFSTFGLGSQLSTLIIFEGFLTQTKFYPP
jgi:hypothetical protein